MKKESERTRYQTNMLADVKYRVELSCTNYSTTVNGETWLSDLEELKNKLVAPVPAEASKMR